MHRLLVIGCGSIGRRHTRVFRELGVTHIGGVDTRQDRLDQLQEEIGVEATYTDLDAAIADGYEAVVVATPPHIHTPIAQKCAEAGMHLFIEKPLAMDDEGLDKLLSTCAANSLVGYTAYCYRYIPSAARLKEIVTAQPVGRPLTVRLWISSYLPDWHPWEDYRTFYMAKKDEGGGALLDESHGIDLLRWLFGDIESVAAMVGNVSDLEISSDDLATLLLRYKSGVTGSAHFDLLGRSPRIGMEIVCAEGTILWDRIDPKIEIYDAGTKEWSVETFNKTDTVESYPAQAEAFLAAIRNGDTLRNSLENGRETLAVLNAAFEASDTGRVVTIG